MCVGGKLVWVLVCTWGWGVGMARCACVYVGGTLTWGSVSSGPGSASSLEQMFRAVTALWTLHRAAHVDLAACAVGSRAGICARHLCDPVRGPPFMCHCQGSTGGPEHGPVSGDAENHSNRNDSSQGLGSPHPPSIPYSRYVLFPFSPQFSPLKTRELSHFLNLRGWQVAEQDGSQAQDLGLCCTTEGVGAGGGGPVARERQGSHLSSLGFTALAQGCMSDHPAFPILWREGLHNFTLSQELGLWGSGSWWDFQTSPHRSPVWPSAMF